VSGPSPRCVASCPSCHVRQVVWAKPTRTGSCTSRFMPPLLPSSWAPQQVPIRHAPPSARGRSRAHRPTDRPDIAKAESGAKRRKLLDQLFDRVYQDRATTVAVKPRAVQALLRGHRRDPEPKRNPRHSVRSSGVSIAGATGVEAACGEIRNSRPCWLSGGIKRDTMMTRWP
jgi:hypothetical protein